MKLTILIIFITLLLSVKSMAFFEDFRRFNPKDWVKCRITENVQLELGEEELNLSQDNFNACYAVAPLMSILFEINKTRKRKKKNPIEFSVSHTLCQVSRYQDGGVGGPAVFLSIMENGGGICLTEDESISHSQFINIFKKTTSPTNSCHPQFSDLEKTLVSMRQMIADNDEFLRKSSETILLEHSKSCKKNFKIPKNMQVHVFFNKDSKQNLEKIKSIIKNGHIASINIGRHETNVTGYKVLKCKQHKEIMLLTIQDPNGKKSSLNGVYFADEVINNISKSGFIYSFDFLPDKEKQKREFIVGDLKLFFEVVASCNYSDLTKITDIIEKSTPAEIGEVSNGGLTPLMYAVLKGHKDIVELLIRKNANVNQTDKDGVTPLMYAAIKGHKDIIELLIEKNANVNQADTYGITPLIWAVILGRKDIVELLIQKKANINHADLNGITPFEYAKKKGHKEIENLLIQKDPRIKR